MASILDYVAWRGDLSFTERPFNDVDNLILAELAYSDFDGIAGREPLTLNEAFEIYCRKGRDQSDMSCNPRPLLEACVGTRRFGSLKVLNCVDVYNFDIKKQFAALTFLLEDGTAYVAYRGTDMTLAGWREDLNFAYMMATPAQLEAVGYLNDFCEHYDCPIRVGGHSKGGNLAVFAACFTKRRFKKRIIKVYTNDGPGFNDVITSSDGYREIIGKVQDIIPEDSIVGVLLTNKPEKKVVRSTAKGGGSQHIPYTWMVGRENFDEAESQTQTSLFLDRTLDGWMDRLAMHQKEGFVSAIFESLEGTGARTLDDLSNHRWTTYNAIVRTALELPNARKAAFKEAVLGLAVVSRDMIMVEAKTRFLNKEGQEVPDPEDEAGKDKTDRLEDKALKEEKKGQKDKAEDRDEKEKDLPWYKFFDRDEDDDDPEREEIWHKLFGRDDDDDDDDDREEKRKKMKKGSGWADSWLRIFNGRDKDDPDDD